MSCWIAGDIHGGTRNLEALVAQIPADDPSPQLVLAGDVGLAYGGIRHYDLQEAMASHPRIRFLVMRGNHDIRYQRDIRSGAYLHKAGGAKGFDALWNDPEHSSEPPLSWCMADRSIPNIVYLPDTPWSTFDEDMARSFLFIPGAHSVDRRLRLREGLPYEPEELLTALELAEAAEALSAICSPDPPDACPPLAAIVSHTCPQSVMPHLQDLLLPYPGLDEDLSQEQFLDILLGMALEQERPGAPSAFDWWFGHFHGDRDIRIRRGDAACDAHLLFRKVRLLSQDNLVIEVGSRDRIDRLWGSWTQRREEDAV